MRPLHWLLLTLPLLTCYSEAARQTQPLQPVTLQLRWHHQFQFAGYYAAKQQGYYAEAGFDVTLNAGSPGIEPVKEVLAGHAHYGVANSELLHQRLQGKPLIALAAIFQHSASVFMARQDSGIQSPQDLNDRNVMMISKGADVGLIAMLKNEGLDLDRINIIKSSYDIHSLIDGQVDAFNSYLTNEPYFMAQHDIPIIILRPSTYGVDFYSDILFTTEQELISQPERVKQFRAASLKGWKYAMENPEETIDLIMAQYNDLNKSRDHLQFEADSMRRLIMPNVVEYGHMNPGRWKHMAEVFVREGMAEPDYDLKGFIYNPNPIHDDSEWHAIVLSLLISLVIFGSITTALYYYNRKLKLAIEFGLQTQNQLQEQTAQFEAIFRSTPDATLICNQQGEIVLCNPAFSKTFGYTAEQALGETVSFLYHRQETYQERKDKHLGHSLSDDEVDYRRSNGECFPSQSISGPIIDAEGKVFGSILVMRDITAQRRSQREIVQMALTDPLTNLANRHQFNRRLTDLFQLAKRQQQLLSLAFMDLDLFKQVNDQFGHPVGDKLLIKVAAILKKTFRETDTIARIGGDEFAILMLNPADHEEICQPANRLIQALSQPIDIEGNRVTVGVSFGVASYPMDTKDPEELYRLADKALYQSKENGRNCCSLANNSSISQTTSTK